MLKKASPAVTDFQAVCKSLQFQNSDIITKVSNALCASDTVLRLQSLALSPAFTKVLQKLLQKLPKITHVCLYSCYFEDPANCGFLVQDFTKAPFTHLSLDYMAMNRETLTPFLSLSIESLSLRGNQCITVYNYKTRALPSAFPESFNSFMSSLTVSSIKTLNLSNCHIGDIGAKALATVLFFNTTIRCLSLVRNRIGDEGASALASALGFYTLNEGEVMLVERLVSEEARSLISDEGGSLVKRKKGPKPAPVKKAPPRRRGVGARLQDRQLDFNPAAAVSAVVLKKWSLVVHEPGGPHIIPGNRTLTALVLDENEVGETGAADLEKMLEINEQLIHLSVAHNPELNPDVITKLTRGKTT